MPIQSSSRSATVSSIRKPPNIQAAWTAAKVHTEAPQKVPKDVITLTPSAIEGFHQSARVSGRKRWNSLVLRCLVRLSLINARLEQIWQVLWVRHLLHVNSLWVFQVEFIRRSFQADVRVDELFLALDGSDQLEALIFSLTGFLVNLSPIRQLIVRKECISQTLKTFLLAKICVLLFEGSFRHTADFCNQLNCRAHGLLATSLEPQINLKPKRTKSWRWRALNTNTFFYISL